MDERTIETWQAARVRKALFPLFNYLFRLRKRMERVFPPRDKLLALVSKAYDAMHALYNELHYLSCESGVGRESRQNKQGPMPRVKHAPPSP
jgi:hypothetical protein